MKYYTKDGNELVQARNDEVLTGQEISRRINDELKWLNRELRSSIKAREWEQVIRFEGMIEALQWTIDTFVE